VPESETRQKLIVEKLSKWIIAAQNTHYYFYKNSLYAADHHFCCA
jgi:hypothetical protein